MSLRCRVGAFHGRSFCLLVSRKRTPTLHERKVKCHDTMTSKHRQVQVLQERVIQCMHPYIVTGTPLYSKLVQYVYRCSRTEGLCCLHNKISRRFRKVISTTWLEYLEHPHRRRYLFVIISIWRLYKLVLDHLVYPFRTGFGLSSQQH
jgi:hypothetical protein